MNKMQLPSEWEEQAAIMLAWPNELGDWEGQLNEVQTEFLTLLFALRHHVPLILLYDPRSNQTKQQLKHQIENLKLGTNLAYYSPNSTTLHPLAILEIPYNDTWMRDTGPICLRNSTKQQFVDFSFNGWGLKYPADLDNAINSKLKTYLPFLEWRKSPLILEGGSIESNGQGLLLTTGSCLFNENRNRSFSKETLLSQFSTIFNTDEILALKNGELKGDDTDGHIDTLVRFLDEKTVIFQSSSSNPVFFNASLKQLEQELY
jgi:agmatine deiminase